MIAWCVVDPVFAVWLSVISLLSPLLASPTTFPSPSEAALPPSAPQEPPGPLLETQRAAPFFTPFSQSSLKVGLKVGDDAKFKIGDDAKLIRLWRTRFRH